MAVAKWQSGKVAKKVAVGHLVVAVVCLAAGFALGRVWPSKWYWPSPRPRIALIIDDCGYHATTLPILRTIERPLTLAVLPHLAYSRAMAEAGGERRFEIMLHLPLEPRDGQVPERGLERHTLTTRMSRDEIRRRLDKALESVPHVKGVNNHMGSKATADAALMRVILEELKARDLYFVDSLVIPNSVCERVASAVGLRHGTRSVFLDNENRPAYIRRQIQQLVAVAKSRGSAIGIGHDRELTLSVIRQMIPDIEAQGVRLVHVSDVVRN